MSSILPMHEPLLIFTVLIGVIFLSPFFFRLFHIPDVAAFILMGVIIGPYGFHVLARDSSIDLLGTIGLLYIMFMAGLELDMDKLKVNKKNSVVFGLATFLIPFVFGFVVSDFLLQLENQATILISIMFATHTLVAYPIVRRLGVNRDISVLTAVGGTIITDTLVLLILSIVTQDFQFGKTEVEIVKLIVFFSLYTATIFYSFPRIAQWFFKYIKRDRPVHFLFLLFMVCVSSLAAEQIGTEPIIGAFLAGLALNRNIPKNSLLMHHIDFVGNILFIPAFLIGIGMLINTRILTSGAYLWNISLILIVTAFAGKWIAAFIAQKTLKFSTTQRTLLFGLTSSHAAATIAIILIGYEKQMIDISIFNATILIILVSSLAASLITEKAGRNLVLNKESKNEPTPSDRILVPISNPANMANLIGIANSFQSVNPNEAVYVLNILNENKSSRDNILKIKEALEENVAEFNHLHENLKVITRVDLSISSGIIRAAKEYMATDIVFGWSVKNTTSKKIFGNIFDHLLNSTQTLYAINIVKNISEYHRFIVHIPSNTEFEPTFISIINKLNKLPKQNDHMIYRVESETCGAKLKIILPKKNKHNISIENAGFNKIEEGKENINIVFLLRKQAVAFNAKTNSAAQKMLANEYSSGFITIVPGFE